MSIARTLALMRKEFRHILRDPQILFTALLAPAVVLFLLAYTFAADLETVRIGVMDCDRSPASRQYLAALTADGSVQRVAECASYDDVLALLRRAGAGAVIVIPPGYGASLASGRPLAIQAVLDGSDYMDSAQVYRDLAQRTTAYGTSLAQTRAGTSLVPIEVHVRALYNAPLKWIHAMIPGLMAAAFCFPAIAMALACTRETEQGSYEGLLSTPLRTPEYLLGKLLPYLLTGSLASLLTWGLALAWFHVPFRGTLGSYLLLGAVFLLSLMSLSILVGAAARNQRHAIIIIVLIFFIPTFFLSGLLIPLEPGSRMAAVLKTVLPAANYVIINRAIFLKGLGAGAVRGEVANLLRISAVALVASYAVTRRKVA
jgi:ABC-2 type transport system permease protein